MSAELLNFEDSWMKLDVADLHFQIDFVHMGVCTHISRDKGGIMFDSLWAMRWQFALLAFEHGWGTLVPQFPFIEMEDGLGDIWNIF